MTARLLLIFCISVPPTLSFAMLKFSAQWALHGFFYGKRPMLLLLYYNNYGKRPVLLRQLLYNLCADKSRAQP